VLGGDYSAGAVPSGESNLARHRFGVVLQHRARDHADSGRGDHRNRDAACFAPLVRVRRTRATPALSIQHRDDRPRALYRLAGMGERSRRGVVGFSARRDWALQIILRRIK